MSVPQSKDAALRKAETFIRRAAKKGAEIICLPELFATPYFPQSPHANAKKYCEPIPGTTTTAMSALARELNVVLIVPICEKTKNGACFNAAVVFNENGAMLGAYRKHHIPHDPGFYEKTYFRAGNEGYRIFKTRHATFAVLICYDQWFPEAARMARLKGAEIIFYPTAIGDLVGYTPPEGKWHEAWEIVQRSHAITNHVAVAAVNRAGKESRIQFWGRSFICDAFGRVLARGDRKEHVITATIDLSLNQRIASDWGFLKNRRPDTYTLGL